MNGHHREERPGPVRDQLSGLGGWYRLAWRYTFTLQRIYKSVIGGFAVAGLASLIPASRLSVVFLHPTNPAAVLENAALGVGIGVVSFIASIGIVPFAAALRFAGAGFAAVLGIIIADNITIPVLSLWRRFDGPRAAAYTFTVFFTAMTAASFAIYHLFGAAHILPSRPAVTHLTQDLAFRLDYTFWLTLAFVALTIAMWIVRREDQRRGAVQATCPVCGLPMEQRHAAATRPAPGSGTAYLCSAACAARYGQQAAGRQAATA